ncbi:MAG: hypothetical protein F6K11_31320 [Leptolyngbya sp. SIO3F4]|nr:hypothetical protein [Leptolyngbya sp. SIO3F4]
MSQLTLERLRQLSRCIPQSKYNLGSIVEMLPGEFDRFEPGTKGLILSINTFNDSEDGSPYIAYKVQIHDDPPSDRNDFFDGFCYEDDWCVHVFESRIVKVIN